MVLDYFVVQVNISLNDSAFQDIQITYNLPHLPYCVVLLGVHNTLFYNIKGNPYDNVLTNQMLIETK